MRPGRALRGLALSAGVLALLLGGGELAARLAARRSPDLAAVLARDWYRLTPDTCWEPVPGYEGRVYGVWRAFGERGLLRADEEELGRAAPRVALLGDSCTFGHRVPEEETFAARLEQLLPGVDTVNLGVPGYSSLQVLRRLPRALELAPDAVVLSANFNDRRYVLRAPDGEFDWAARAREERSLAGRIERGSYLVRVLRRLGGADDGEEPRHVPGLRLGDLSPRVPPDAYRANLEAAVERARAAGARVVLLLLGDAPGETELLRQGLARRAAGEAAAAEELFALAEERGGQFATLARELRRRSLAERGDPAAEELDELPELIPSLLGGRPLATDAEYHAVLRDVAARLDVPLVDGAAALQPGDYFDFCHFGPAGHERVAQALAAGLAPLLE